MSVTGKLVRLHRVEVQIRGLTERLRSAERYLAQQDALLASLNTQRDALRAQLKQVEATFRNDETEAAAIDDKIKKLRDQMNAATSNKQYAAFLTEINTLKADKSEIDTRALTSLTKLDEVKAQVGELDTQIDEREQVRKVALNDRDTQAAAVKDRLEELRKEREVAAADVPAHALSTYEARIRIAPDDIMAPLEEYDRRNREYACGSCQMLLPLEKLNALISRGELTACTACGAILFLDENVREGVVNTGRR